MTKSKYIYFSHLIKERFYFKKVNQCLRAKAASLSGVLAFWCLLPMLDINIMCQFPPSHHHNVHLYSLLNASHHICSMKIFKLIHSIFTWPLSDREPLFTPASSLDFLLAGFWCQGSATGCLECEFQLQSMWLPISQHSQQIPARQRCEGISSTGRKK